MGGRGGDPGPAPLPRERSVGQPARARRRLDRRAESGRGSAAEPWPSGWLQAFGTWLRLRRAGRSRRLTFGTKSRRNWHEPGTLRWLPCLQGTGGAPGGGWERGGWEQGGWSAAVVGRRVAPRVAARAAVCSPAVCVDGGPLGGRPACSRRRVPARRTCAHPIRARFSGGVPVASGHGPARADRRLRARRGLRRRAAARRGRADRRGRRARARARRSPA